jgi:hypothetical protein
VASGAAISFQPRHEELGHRRAELMDRLIDDGDRWAGDARPIGVMKGDQRQVVRDGQAELARATLKISSATRLSDARMVVGGSGDFKRFIASVRVFPRPFAPSQTDRPGAGTRAASQALKKPSMLPDRGGVDVGEVAIGVLRCVACGDVGKAAMAMLDQQAGRGRGNDTASYAGSTAGVVVNLVSGTVSGGDAQGDTLLSIESVGGSALADTLTGN